MRVLILIGLLLVPSLASAQVFETNEWNNRTQAGWIYSTGFPTIDAAPTGGSSPSGGSALKFSYPAGTHPSSISGGIADFFATPNGLTDLYLGHWLKFSSPYSWNPIGNKVNYIYGQIPLTLGFLPYVTIRIGAGGSGFTYDNGLGGNSALDPNHSRSNNVGGSITFIPGTWYWFEEHVKLNTVGQRNGVIEVWINDILKMTYSDVAIIDNAQTWGAIKHSPEWGGSGGTISQNQFIWFDHTVISTTRIGMPGGAPPPTGDTVLPSTPTGLTVN